jgi:hypothetical protein
VSRPISSGPIRPTRPPMRARAPPRADRRQRLRARGGRLSRLLCPYAGSSVGLVIALSCVSRRRS